MKSVTLSNETLGLIDGLMKKSGTRGSIEFYPEAEHGFAFPRRRAFHKASAERHWERLFELFARNL